MSNKEFDNLGEAITGRQIEGNPAITIQRTDVRATAHEQLGQFQVKGQNSSTLSIWENYLTQSGS